MSEDGFLTRWSRRKAEAKAEPLPAPPREEEAADEAQPQPAPVEASEEQANEEVDLSALPPIEEITSATDITGFLQRGVPEALRTAALRKAWASDPAIRDFIGPSENAWDFNDPAGIPGFGPIDMPADRVRQMAAELVGEVREAAEKAEGALEQIAAQHERAPSLPNAQNKSSDCPVSGGSPEQNEVTAPRQEASAEAESRPRPRSHGSALPR